MWWRFEEAIVESCETKIRGFEQYRKRVYDENRRRQRRSSGSPNLLIARRPILWDLDSGFDPFHVRTRSGAISHAVAQKLRKGTYKPFRPAGFRIPKRTGGDRLVSSFAIADEVISSKLYRSLLRKNRPRLSARSYAYRDDIGVHDAIMYLQSEWRGEQRIFLAEFDFTEFFESISHDHIRRSVEALELIMTPLEKRLINAFLVSPSPYTTVLEKTLPEEPRTRGVLLGTSISLLLANIAVSPLDRALERMGVNFVRYADDTLIWSRDYSSICRAVDEIYDFSARSGVEINEDKSKGVRLLVPPKATQAEFTFVHEVEFLSHSIGLRSTAICHRVLREIRDRIQKILLNNLLREPLKDTQDFSRLGLLDRDYVSYVWQLRRYLYGHLSESDVRRLSRASVPRMRLGGVIAQFPLAIDKKSLQELDGWICTQTWLAVKKRASLVGMGSVFMGPPIPWGLSRERLLTLKSISSTTGEPVDLRLPSAVRMGALVRRAVKIHGTRIVGQGATHYGS